MSDNQTKLEIWKEYLLNQKNSGLSVRTWCFENQISQPQFYYWKRKLSQETLAQPKFAEICFVDQQTEKHKGEIGSLFQVSYKGIEIVISSFATVEQITNLLVSAPRYLVERLPNTLTITAL